MNENLYVNKNLIRNEMDEILYGKKPPEPIASKIFRHFGYCCAGAYIGFLISEDLPLAMLSLGLAWGSVVIRHYALKYKK